MWSNLWKGSQNYRLMSRDTIMKGWRPVAMTCLLVILGSRTTRLENLLLKTFMTIWKW